MTIIAANHDPFFEDINNPWSVWWEEEVKRIHDLLWKWKVLDLGFWVWRHVKQLLDLDYDLTWVELSKIWYTRLQEELVNKKKCANLYLGDMFEFQFDKKYDCIFSNMTLQYSDSEQKFAEMIAKMKKNTNIWGINYIKLPAHWMSLWFPFKILDLGALKYYYHDWEILFDKFETQKKEDGKLGVYVTIIARKKS